jgi:hypothetical protein
MRNCAHQVAWLPGAHNLKVIGSNPIPATKKGPGLSMGNPLAAGCLEPVGNHLNTHSVFRRFAPRYSVPCFHSASSGMRVSNLEAGQTSLRERRI